MIMVLYYCSNMILYCVFLVHRSCVLSSVKICVDIVRSSQYVLEVLVINGDSESLLGGSFSFTSDSENRNVRY